MSSRGMRARNAVFSHTEVVSESKMVPEMLCFTIESAGGCGGRRCEMAVAAMVAYGHLWSPMLAYAWIGPPLGSVIAGAWSNAVEWWFQGAAGLPMVQCYWEMALQVTMVARCFEGMAIQGFHGVALLL